MTLRECRNENDANTYYLGLERLSSHCVEQYFGQYRNHYLGKYQIKNAFRFAVKAAISIEFQSNVGVDFTIYCRDNYGGTHLHYQLNGKEEDDKSITIYSQNEIKEMALDVIQNATKQDMHYASNTKNFILEIQKFLSLYPSPKEKNVSASKGANILPNITSTKRKRGRKNKQKSRTKNNEQNISEQFKTNVEPQNHSNQQFPTYW
ncbi:hypothetical protein M9Y10_021392 [Tritrichomonas musculus]|uniref:Uncharacterized protein n=1 Tax=Tritrichomonas musculus TaxID=1915356 RepID=A0ABR2HEW8_9EUKA